MEELFVAVDTEAECLAEVWGPPVGPGGAIGAKSRCGIAGN